MIYGDFFAHLFYSSRGIARYQVHQYSKGEVDINLVMGKAFDSNEITVLKNQLAQMCKDDLKANFTIVDEIDVSASGKRRSVISHLAHNRI